MSVYLEIGIAIVFVFLILSLLVTAVTELIASVFRLRARVLRAAISEIVSDPEYRKHFYGQRLLIGWNAKQKDNSTSKEPNATEHPSYISGSMFSRALLLTVLEADGEGKSLSETSFGDLRLVISKIRLAPLRTLLSGLMDDSIKSARELEAAVESWFDGSMDRLSGRFKRYQQWVSFVVGFALAVSFNLDVVRLSSDLYQDDVLRARLVAEADARVRAQQGIDDDATTSTPQENLNNISELYADLEGFGIGWQDDGPPFHYHIPGWLLAAFASILGAPFWFDVLSRFVKIRGTGARPKDAADADKAQTGES